MVPLDGVSVRQRASARFIVLLRYAERPGVARRWVRSECVWTAHSRPVQEYWRNWLNRHTLSRRLGRRNRQTLTMFEITHVECGGSPPL
jgi:hypothetical protein